MFVVSFSMRWSSQRARGCREHIDVRNTSRKPGCRTRSRQASFSDSVVDRGEWPAHRMGLDLRLHCEGEGRSERSTLVTIVPQIGARANQWSSSAGLELHLQMSHLDATSVPGMREGLTPRMSVDLKDSTRLNHLLTYQPPLTNTAFIPNSLETHPDPPPANWRSGFEGPNTSLDASRSRYYPNLLG